MKKGFFAAISVLIIFYLAIAFVTWDFNSAHWSQAIRGLLASFGLFVAVIVAIVVAKVHE